MKLVEEIARELAETDLVVEATFGDDGARQYALEAGTRICLIPAVRVARVDSAELIGFIFNMSAIAPRASYDEFAQEIIDRFALKEVTA